MINIENIKVGQIYPNMKALLVAVGLQSADELLKGNTFKAQIKILEMYVEYERVPHSQRVIIKKIKEQ